jgi:hypothetical protein
MTDADKTAEKLAASIRKTKADAASKPAAAPRKAAPKRAAATSAKAPAARTTKAKTPAEGNYQFGRRVWPD